MWRLWIKLWIVFCNVRTHSEVVSSVFIFLCSFSSSCYKILHPTQQGKDQPRYWNQRKLYYGVALLFWHIHIIFVFHSPWESWSCPQWHVFIFCFWHIMWLSPTVTPSWSEPGMKMWFFLFFFISFPAVRSAEMEIFYWLGETVHVDLSQLLLSLVKA